MEEIEILKFKLKIIAETLRLVHNNYNCSSRDTCLKRMVCQSLGYAREALDPKKSTDDTVVVNGMSYTREEFNELAKQFEKDGGR